MTLLQEKQNRRIAEAPKKRCYFGNRTAFDTTAFHFAFKRASAESLYIELRSFRG